MESILIPGPFKFMAHSIPVNSPLQFTLVKWDIWYTPSMFHFIVNSIAQLTGVHSSTLFTVYSCQRFGYTVHTGPLQSTSVHSGLFQSTVQSKMHFRPGPLRFLVHIPQFIPVHCSLLYLVHSRMRSTTVHVPFQSTVHSSVGVNSSYFQWCMVHSSLYSTPVDGHWLQFIFHSSQCFSPVHPTTLFTAVIHFSPRSTPVNSMVHILQSIPFHCAL